MFRRFSQLLVIGCGFQFNHGYGMGAAWLLAVLCQVIHHRSSSYEGKDALLSTAADDLFLKRLMPLMTLIAVPSNVACGREEAE